MEKLLITGNGPLHGEVVIAGAKNSALPVIAASLLTSDPMLFSIEQKLAGLGAIIRRV
jgi:UDP-N-acetylglucosamine 1-carboxyvinyltransferase